MTDQQNAALEPCPFCGSTLVELDKASGGLKGAVECLQPRCFSRGPLKMEDKAAIAAWNTRPAPAGAEAVREAWPLNADQVKKLCKVLRHYAIKEHFLEGAGMAADLERMALAALAKAPTAAEDGLRFSVKQFKNLGFLIELAERRLDSCNEDETAEDIRRAVESGKQIYAALRAKPEASGGK